MNEPAHRRKGSWWGTIKAVLWGFLGVRRRSDYQEDVTKLNPIHLLVVGIVLAFLFVIGLMTLVHWVVQP